MDDYNPSDERLIEAVWDAYRGMDNLPGTGIYGMPSRLQYRFLDELVSSLGDLMPSHLQGKTLVYEPKGEIVMCKYCTEIIDKNSKEPGWGCTLCHSWMCKCCASRRRCRLCDICNSCACNNAWLHDKKRCTQCKGRMHMTTAGIGHCTNCKDTDPLIKRAV